MSNSIGIGIGMGIGGVGGVGGGGGGGYLVNAVHFDGMNDSLSRGGALIGQSSSELAIFSWWMRVTVDDSLMYLFQAEESAGSDFPLDIRKEAIIPINNIFVVFRDSANVVKVTWDSDISTYEVADEWIHTLIGLDLDAGTPVMKVYINDVAHAGSFTQSPVAADVDWGGIDDFFIGINSANDFRYDGDMAEVYINNGEYLDFDTESNRRFFIDSGGSPVDLGSDGSTPTGTAPIIFFSGDTDSWHTNKGSGGGFTETGALTTAATSPSD